VRVGDLCRLGNYHHQLRFVQVGKDQIGNIVLITSTSAKENGVVFPHYCVGINLTTGKQWTYPKSNLEVISESR